MARPTETATPMERLRFMARWGMAPPVDFLHLLVQHVDGGLGPPQ